MSHEIHTQTLKICQQAEKRGRDSEVIGSLTFPCNFRRIMFGLSCCQLLLSPLTDEDWGKNKAVFIFKI